MFVTHVHNFRGLSIMLIVLAHVVSVFDWAQHPELLRAFKVIFANMSVFFLFISGYLFQHLIKGYEYRKYLKTKLNNVIFPYVLISIPAIVLFTTVMQRPEMRAGFYDRSVAWQVAEFYVTGTHLAPFWFIPTVAVYYVISPLLRRADRTPGFYWSLPFWILVTVLSSRSSNPLINCVHYLSVYLTGMACSHHRQAAEEWLSRWWWALVPPFVGLIWVEYNFVTGTHGWQNTLHKLAACLILFEMLRRWGHGGDRWLASTGTLSFGIYFIHSYVISAAKVALNEFGLTPLAGNLPALFASAAIFMLASMLMVAAAKTVTGRYSRQMIGC